jgi:hypothetical protein
LGVVTLNRAASRCPKLFYHVSFRDPLISFAGPASPSSLLLSDEGVCNFYLPYIRNCLHDYLQIDRERLHAVHPTQSLTAKKQRIRQSIAGRRGRHTQHRPVRNRRAHHPKMAVLTKWAGMFQVCPSIRHVPHLRIASFLHLLQRQNRPLTRKHLPTSSILLDGYEA